MQSFDYQYLLFLPTDPKEMPSKNYVYTWRKLAKNKLF